MNSAERLQATLQGHPTDRRAVSLVLSLYGARLTGCPLADYYTDSAAYARGQSAVRETFTPDILFGPFALALYGEAFGSTVCHFDSQPPNLDHPAASTAAEIDRLSTPDIDSHPSLAYSREAIRLMAAEHGDSVPIAAIVLDPVALPIMIMGMDGWLETVLFDEGAMKRMFEITVPHFVEWANALLGDGAAFVVLPVAFANPAIVTREIAVERTIPVMKQAFAQVNGPIVIHPAGAPFGPFLDLLADLPNVVAVAIDHHDSFAEARERVGKELTLLGNVEAPTLAKRGAEDIRAECVKLLHDRRDDPHFILGTSGPDIPLDAPPENIHALVEAAEEFARRGEDE